LPLVALSLWGLYVLDDVAAFKLQFFDWQSARKAARFDAAGAYLLAGGRVLINYGVKGAGILGLTSTVTLAVLLLKALREGSGPRPSLLVAILTLAGGVAVLFGREMAYPPLRLPAFYLGLFLCAESVTDIRSFPKLADVRGGVLRINYPVLFRTVFLAVFVLSVRSTTATLREVRTSPRAQAYDPKVLAARILAATDAGASIGVRLFPDCHDVLERSGHFGAVRKLSWHALNPAELTRYVCENRYLAMTETVLEPRFPGYLRNMTAPAWGGESYRRIAERYYRLHAVVELPGGGATKVYERSSVPAHGREATGCMAPVDGAEGGTAESR